MRETVAGWRHAAVWVVMIAAVWSGGCAAAIDPDAISDAETVARVKTALVNDAVLGPRAIEVRVVRGVAVLSGRVASDEEHARALRIVRAVPGVADVDGAPLVVGEIPVADPAPAGTVTGDPSAELEALERRPGLLALGAAVATSRPAEAVLAPRWSVSPLVRIGRSEGLGVAVGFSWFSSDLGPETGARLQVRPVMAGVGYTVRRGEQLSVAASVVGGYAFNSLGPPDRAGGGAVPVGVANSFAWRPSVSVWRDLGERTALNMSLSYVLTSLDVSYLQAGRIETRDVSGNTVMVRVGLAYTLF